MSSEAHEPTSTSDPVSRGESSAHEKENGAPASSGAHAEPDAEEDAPTCRICMQTAEEAPELGRLIRPCLCKGTMAFVHVQCLNRWRKEAHSAGAFMRCQQCGYNYRLARTRVVGLASSPIVLGFSTLTLFTIMVFLSSFVASIWLPSGWLDNPSFEMSTQEDSSLFYSWMYFNSPTYYASWMYKTAFEALNDIIEPDRHYQPPTRTKIKASKPRRLNDPLVVQDGKRSGPFKTSVYVPRSGVVEEKNVPPPPPPPALSPFWKRLIRRFILGLAVVGSFSFVNFLYGTALMLPLRIWGRRRRGDNARDTYAMVVLIFLLIGLARALYKTYGVTRTIAAAWLKRFETAILEVAPEDDTDGRRAQDANLQRRLRRMVNDFRWRCIRYSRGVWETIWRTVTWENAQRVPGRMVQFVREQAERPAIE